jgi:hypothetical protein
MRTAFGDLLERLRKALAAELAVTGDLVAIRSLIKGRAEAVTLHANEPRLKAFSLRLTDSALVGDSWLESLGSMLATQPPVKWRDSEEDAFVRELSLMSQRFRDLEAISFKDPKRGTTQEAYKLALTRQDGYESQEVIFVDQERVREVETIAEKIRKLIGSDRSVALAALSRATWQALEDK